MTDPKQVITDAEAHQLYQGHLDAATRLVLEGNTEAFCDYVALPYVYRTGAGEQICETGEEMQQDIGDIHAWLRSIGATDYYRIARRARFVGQDMIEGYHLTYALRGAIPLVEPYSSRMILRRVEGRWLAAMSEHELSKPLFSSHPIRASHGLFSNAWNTESNAATRDQADARPFYQELIDAMSVAQNTHDFDGWYDLFTHPYHVHYNAADHVAETAEDVRPFFDAIYTMMQENGADLLERKASFASFVSDDRLLGYHDTTMTKNGQTRFGPVKSRMIFVLSDAGWKCSSVTNSLSNTGFPGGTFVPTEQLPTMRQIQKRMRK
jgi:hypothetical protein